MRRPIVAGNWKMHCDHRQAEELARSVVEGLAPNGGVDVVLCPSFTSLRDAGEILSGTPVALGAQDVHWAPDGAYTGEVSIEMLRSLGCRYVIVGHSERRTWFGETDRNVSLKTAAVLAAGLCPIVCIGETLEERSQGMTETVLGRQIEQGMGALGSTLADVVVAYEPVWAIGTGQTATPAEAQQAHAFIRRRLAELADADLASGVRIQYGGSVKPENAAELFANPDVDGGLIGGAALDAGSFNAIVRAAG